MNTSFWLRPPWHGGVGKHRLGLSPMDTSAWLSEPPSSTVLVNKRRLLTTCYEDVVAVLPEAAGATSLLATLPLPTPPMSEFADTIANVALTVSDDLCVLDCADQQRLVAAAVCAPSYWRLSDKIGLPLLNIHGPVDGMNAKIGSNIERFISRAPVAQPFVRENWFLHDDDVLYHPEPDSESARPVEHWLVRSERQTLCKLSSRYLLFTIDVVCEPLADIATHAAARDDLLRSLNRMSADEITHFGGDKKYTQLYEHLSALAN